MNIILDYIFLEPFPMDRLVQRHYRHPVSAFRAKPSFIRREKHLARRDPGDVRLRLPICVDLR